MIYLASSPSCVVIVHVPNISSCTPRILYSDDDAAFADYKHQSEATLKASAASLVKTQQELSAITKQLDDAEESKALLNDQLTASLSFREAFEKLRIDFEARVKKDGEMMEKSKKQSKEDEAEINRLKSELIDMHTVNDDQKRSLSFYEDEVSKHVNARTATSHDLNSVQKAKQALDKRMADLEAQGRKDQDTINDLRKQVAKLQSEKDANDAAAQQRISFLEGQGKRDADELIAVIADKGDADKRIAILDAQNKNATDEIDRLRKQLDLFQQRVLALESQGVTDIAEIDSLQRSVNILEGHCKQGAAEIDAAKKHVAGLTQQLAEKTDILTALAQEFSDFKNDAENTIKSSSADLNGREKTLAEQQMLHKKDTASIQALNNQVAEQTDILESLAQEFAAYKDDAENTIKQSSAALATSETALATSETALARANKSNNELESDNQQLQDQLMGLAKEFQSFKEATEDSTSASKVTLDRTARELAAVSKVKTELDTANAKLKQQLTTLTNEFNEYRDDAENTIKSSSADLSGKEKTLAELQMLHKKDTASIQALNKQVAEQADILESLAQEFATYKGDAENMIKESSSALATSEE